MSKFGFDLNEYQGEERGSYDPIPKGEYKMKATEAEFKDTRSGGQMIAVTFEVVGGEHNGRKIWNNFNVVNNSEKAQRIGREQVSAWAKAAGKPNATDFNELLERPFGALVDIEKGTDGYADKNRIYGFIQSSSSAPAPTAAKKAAPAPAAKSLLDLEEDVPPPVPKTEAPAGGKKNPWD